MHLKETQTYEICHGAFFDPPPAPGCGHFQPADYAEAMKWYWKAADQGKADAQNNIGVMYAEGEGG